VRKVNQWPKPFSTLAANLLTSPDSYGLLEAMGIESVVKPKRNARLDTGPPARRLAVSWIRELGHEAWSRLTGYGRQHVT
jgi:hypothetical protein